LEGYIADENYHPMIGLQAKFFDNKLESTQWRNLKISGETAIRNNTEAGALVRIVVTLPRNLTEEQNLKWIETQESWFQLASDSNYRREDSV